MEKQCTLLINYDKAGDSEVSNLQTDLEKGDIPTVAAALKRVIMLIINGEVMPQMLMTIIRFVMPKDDHALKKLTLLFLEVVEKTKDGKLLPEMILVCNMLRNDLNHANEFVRGITLRFMTKLREPEIIEPLVPAIKLNLEHRHSYVRRYATMAIFNIYSRFEHLIPDAPEIVETMLQTESDTSTQRNAFLMLYQCAQDRAVDYLVSVIEQVSSFGDIVQLVMLELVRKVCRANPLEKSRYIKCIFTLLTSASTAVSFDCAGTLIALSSATPAVRAATSSYCQLLSTHSDNNVKLIVLDRLMELKTKHPAVMNEMLMDIMRALGSPNVDIRKKVLDLAMDLISPRNIDEVVHVLKREVMKTQSSDQDKPGEYRQLLIQAIHTCVLKFPEVANSVVHLLMDFLGDSNAASAADVVCFVREVVETYPKLREPILTRMNECFHQIKAPRVFRVALWIFSQYSSTLEELTQALDTLKAAIGPLPLHQETDETQSTDKPAAAAAAPPVSKPVVLADGTYATQSFASESSASASGKASASAAHSDLHLRNLLLGGDYFLGSCVASAITKIGLRLVSIFDLASDKKNALTSEILLILCSIIRLGVAPASAHKIDEDAHEHISMCIRVLADPEGSTLRDVWLNKCRDSFAVLLAEKHEKARQEEEEAQGTGVKAKAQADDLIIFRQLKGRTPGATLDPLDDDEISEVTRATGSDENDDDFCSRLSRVTQLTGLSDPIYAECVVTVHQYDIMLDLLVVNQTDETLQNVCLELATVGDLKLCERPQSYTLPPRGTRDIRANIKVASTEAGIIFGNIIYDPTGPQGASLDNRNCVILNDIHIDIMDYISPAPVSDVQFRSMWAEFEWENKVTVNTAITSVTEFLEHIVKSTNMKCLTPSFEADDCGFLAANLYAKSVFGEDALVNLSVELGSDGKIGGSIRIRSKTQGIALSLGDKITLKQKGGG